MNEIELWQFTRSHPDCQHCKTVLQSMTIWSKETHMTCPCICHGWHKERIMSPPKKRGRAAR